MQTSPAPVKVYLADDSAPIRRRIGTLLASQPVTVIGEGETPQDCIAGILGSSPDVVVLDCQLEGGTGLEVLRAVHRAQPAIAFVVFSNSSGDAYRKRYLAEGAVCFLDKSSDFDQLAQAVLSASPRFPH